MRVNTLDDVEFEKTCISLASKIILSDGQNVLIGIRTGGAVVAQIVFECLSRKDKNLTYFEVGAARLTTAPKKSKGIKFLFNCFPYYLLDKLRVIEYYIVRLRMLIEKKADRSISMDRNLENYLSNTEIKTLYVIDDAIDSGATIMNLLNQLQLINPSLSCKVAVLVVTQKKSLVNPDVVLFRDVLLRFPWSNDFKK